MLLYDATSYTNPPPGLEPFTIIYEDTLFSTGDHNEVDYERLADVATDHANDPLICLNIESWALNDGHRIRQNDSIAKYREVLRTFKNIVSPDTLVGYFNVLPPADPHLANGTFRSSGYNRWKTICDKVQPIADYADVIFPSVYVRYYNPTFQLKIINEYIHAAHNYGIKSIIPFIYPYYSNLLDDPAHNDEMIPGWYMERIMTAITAKTSAAVLWGKSGDTEFDPGTWWAEIEPYINL